MKVPFRRSMRELHTSTGLVLSWLLYFIFLTGTAGYFDTEIDRWMQPELPLGSQQAPQENLVGLALQQLNEKAPWSERWMITLPTEREGFLRIGWKKPESKAPFEHGESMQREILDHETGQITQPRDTAGGQALYRLHYRLHYMPATLAFWIVGLASMFMLLALVTGIIIHKKIFKDFFTFRPAKGTRSWLDAHNVLSVLALPFHIMITYSGLAFFIFTYMSMVFVANYDINNMSDIREEAFPRQETIEPAGIHASMTDLTPLLATARQHFNGDAIRDIVIEHPNDMNSVIKIRRHESSLFPRNEADKLQFNAVSGKLLTPPSLNLPGAAETRSLLVGLHRGKFAGVYLRWLYFLSGLLGTAMIATGLLLWVEKRRFKYENKQAPTTGYILVQRLNAGVIIGLPIAIAVYFLANRLLPIDIVSRGAWELNALFISLALAMVSPFLRDIKHIWVEMLTAAAVLFFAIPLVNAATTTHHHLLATAQAKDWTLFFFDISMLSFGLFFAICAYRLQQRKATPGKKTTSNFKRKTGSFTKAHGIPSPAQNRLAHKSSIGTESGLRQR